MNIRWTGNNITAKILSVLFAGLLWFYVTTNATFTTKYTIPIQYVGPSAGYVLSSAKPDKATLVISGTGKQLVGFYVLSFARSDKRYALVNLTGLREGSNTVKLDMSMIHLGFYSDLNVENILYPNNASFTVYVDREIKRTVAVDAAKLGDYRIGDGFCVVGKPAVKPEFAVIQGPSEIVQRYNSVAVTPISGATLTPNNSVLTVPLTPPEFVQVEPAAVEIQFAVEQLISKQLSGLPVVLRGFPRRNRPVIEPDSLLVSFKGPKSLLTALEAGNVVLAIEYERYLDFVARGDSLITPSVTLPDGYETVNIVDVIPRAVRLAVKSARG